MKVGNILKNLKKSKLKKSQGQGHRHKMFSATEVIEIQKMYNSGVSKRQIAVHFGCSEKTIRNYLKNQ